MPSWSGSRWRTGCCRPPPDPACRAFGARRSGPQVTLPSPHWPPGAHGAACRQRCLRDDWQPDTGERPHRGRCRKGRIGMGCSHADRAGETTAPPVRPCRNDGADRAPHGPPSLSGRRLSPQMLPFPACRQRPDPPAVRAAFPSARRPCGSDRPVRAGTSAPAGSRRDAPIRDRAGAGTGLRPLVPPSAARPSRHARISPARRRMHIARRRLPAAPADRAAPTLRAMAAAGAVRTTMGRVPVPAGPFALDLPAMPSGSRTRRNGPDATRLCRPQPGMVAARAARPDDILRPPPPRPSGAIPHRRCVGPMPAVSGPCLRVLPRPCGPVPSRRPSGPGGTRLRGRARECECEAACGNRGPRPALSPR